MRDGEEKDGQRRWRGKTTDERRSRRRDLLVEAGIELFGTQGYANTSVKAVCDEAGLTERYFYETFDDREDLLSGIFDILIEDEMEATLTAISEAEDDLKQKIGASLSAFATQVTRDSRKARIQEIEVVGVSEALEAKRRQAIHASAALIASVFSQYGAKAGSGPIRLDVVCLGLVGAVNETLIDYVLGHLDVTLEELIANQIGMFETVVETLLAD